MPSASAFVSVPVKSCYCHRHGARAVGQRRLASVLIRSIGSNSPILAINALRLPDGKHSRSATGDRNLSVPGQRGIDSVPSALRAFVFKQPLIVERIRRFAQRRRDQAEETGLNTWPAHRMTIAISGRAPRSNWGATDTLPASGPCARLSAFLSSAMWQFARHGVSRSAI
jgi:hypothetical protein